MFYRNIILAFRKLTRNKLYNSINLLGLSIGLACCILIVSYITFQNSFDSFNEKSDRIYQVLGKYEIESKQVYLPYSAARMAEKLKNNMPEVLKTTRIFTGWGNDKPILSYEKNSFFETGIMAEKGFLEMFSYKVTKGNGLNALSEPNNVLLTEKLANKLFGSADPVGKEVGYKWAFGTNNLKVAGILENIPSNSNLQFGYIISFPTLLNSPINNLLQNSKNGIGITYVELNNKIDKESFQAKFNKFLYDSGIYAGEKYDPNRIYFESIKDTRLNSVINNDDSGAVSRMKELYLFGIIAAIILIMAIVNYINLTIAKAFTRSKEVGIKKVIGASRKELLAQFLMESFLMVGISASIAIILVAVFIPSFNAFTGQSIEVSYLFKMPLLLIIPVTILMIALITGIMPSWILSSFQPSRILGEFSSKGKYGKKIRNLFVVAQFSAAVILIFSLIVINSQMNFIKNRNLGYNKDRVLTTLVGRSDKSQVLLLRDKLKELSCVKNASVCSESPVYVGSFFTDFKTKDVNGNKQTILEHHVHVDENYINLYDLKILKGRNFLPDEFISGRMTACIVNEEFAKKIGTKDPVGMEIGDEQSKFNVVGLVKDFNFETLHKQIKPLILYAYQSSFAPVAIKISGNDIENSIKQIKSVYESVIPNIPFDFKFDDDTFNSLYDEEIKTGQLFNFTSIVSIILAGLGLLGLVSMAMERKTKEIGVRKVCGASVFQIFSKFSLDFLKLIIGALLISLPFAYMFNENWLNDFAYRININPWFFVLTIIITILVALCAVSFQIIKAALVNPVNSLRNE